MSEHTLQHALTVWFVVYVGTFVSLLAYGISETVYPILRGTL